MFAQTLNCGNCGQLVDFTIRSVFDFRKLTPEEINALARPDKRLMNTGPTVQHVQGKDKVQAASLSQCPRCNYPCTLLFETSRDALNALRQLGGSGDSMTLSVPIFTILEQYPPVKQADQDPLWPDSIRRKFADAQKMHSQGISPSIVLTTCGTVLELALKELDPDDKGSTLYKRIENLHDAGVITSPIKDWAHDIRLDRNNAVHEGEGEEKDAAEYIEFLKMFFNMVFSLPARIAEKRT